MIQSNVILFTTVGKIIGNPMKKNQYPKLLKNILNIQKSNIRKIFKYVPRYFKFIAKKQQ